MRVYRTARRFDTVVVRRDGALDQRLSWEAVGVLYFVLCQEDGWEGDVASLVGAHPGGRDRMQRVLRELRETGYAALRKRAGGGRGKAPRWYYEFSDIPGAATEAADAGYQGPAFQAPEKPAAIIEDTYLPPEYVGIGSSGGMGPEYDERELPLAPPEWVPWTVDAAIQPSTCDPEDTGL